MAVDQATPTVTVQRIELTGTSVAGIGLGLAWVWPLMGPLWAVLAIALSLAGMGLFASAPTIRQWHTETRAV